MEHRSRLVDGFFISIAKKTMKLSITAKMGIRWFHFFCIEVVTSKNPSALASKCQRIINNDEKKTLKDRGIYHAQILLG